jgi:spermidine/putrescine transport system substrate-binding protein
MKVSRFSRRQFLQWSALTGAGAALAACQAEPTPEAPVLNLLNWPEYLSPETIDGFQTETGIFINQTIFESNEELQELLTDSPIGTFDLIAPTDHTVDQLIRQQALLPLDRSQLNNITNVDPDFLDKRTYDPASRYSITKAWGTTGLMYRGDLIPVPPRSWAEFWQLVPQHSGRVIMVEERDEVLGIALKLLGYSANATEPAQINEALQKLMELRPHVGLSSEYFTMFRDDVVVMGLGWNGDAFLIRTEYATPVNFTTPQEGGILWEDDWCIPLNALHARNAHRFINYVLRPEVAAAEANYTGYGTAVTPAVPLIEEAIRNDIGLNPPPEVRARLERIALFEAGSEVDQVRQAAWNKFVAG